MGRWDRWDRWAPDVSMEQRQRQAEREMKKRVKKGLAVQPVQISGRTIARSFWGKAWCDHFDGMADYTNRLDRGRRYVRNGSVCHLEIAAGRVEAFVSGSEVYEIAIDVEPLAPARWDAIKGRCAGRIGSMLELLKGTFSDEVMTVVTDRREGLFPLASQIRMRCDCPDGARLCKHLAAVLYGIGARLDTQPELLFTLRGVDSQDLLGVEAALDAAPQPVGKTIAADALADVFGIELDEAPAPAAQAAATVATVERSPRGRGKKALAVPAVTPKAKAPKKAPSTLDQEAVRPAAIRALRKRLDMTAAAFARALRVSTASVTRWESSRKPLKLQARPFQALVKLGLKA